MAEEQVIQQSAYRLATDQLISLGLGFMRKVQGTSIIIMRQKHGKYMVRDASDPKDQAVPLDFTEARDRLEALILLVRERQAGQK